MPRVLHMYMFDKLSLTLEAQFETFSEKTSLSFTTHQQRVYFLWTQRTLSKNSASCIVICCLWSIFFPRICAMFVFVIALAGFPGSSVVKKICLPMQGDTGYAVSIPGLGRSLGEGNRNPLAWRIPWTEEPSRLQSMRVHRVRHDWARMHICNCLSRMGHQGDWEQAWGKIIFSPKKTPGCRWFTWQWIVNSNNVISCKSLGAQKRIIPKIN